MATIYEWPIWVPPALVLVSMFVTNEIGYRIGLGRDRAEPDRSRSVTIALKASIMGLVALLLGFTYAMTSSRFELRQRLVLDQANAIGTCHLRAGLVAEPARTRMRSSLVRYTDLRLEHFGRDSDPAEAARIEKDMDATMRELWAGLEDCVKEDQDLARTIAIVPAANEVIDLASTQLWAEKNQVPATIILLLAACMIVSSMVVGHSSGQNGERHVWLWITTNVLIALVLCVVMDFDRPRHGLIRVNQGPLIQLQQDFRR